MLASRRGRVVAGVLAAGAVFALSACSSGGALDSGSTSSGSSESITVGSAPFGESQILAEIYAQALQAKGVKVDVKLAIGQRPVTMQGLADGSLDLVPEYTGNLLQAVDPATTAQSPAEVYAALPAALPKGLEVLDQSTAEDKDSYNVTKDFAAKYKLKSLSDLAGIGIPLVVGANSEFATRPYGIPGLQDKYGVKDVTLQPISDSGGPKTVQALIGGDVQLADIYSTDPAIKANGFVTLTDPKNIILAQNIVPLINSKKATSTVKTVLNKIQATLTTAQLIELNTENTGPDKVQPAAVAKKWLSEHKID